MRARSYQIRLVKLVLGVMLMGWLGATAHLLTDSHRWCPTHAHFEHDHAHGRAETPHGLKAALPAISFIDTPALRAEPAPDSDRDHASCLVLAHLSRVDAGVGTKTVQSRPHSLCDKTPFPTALPVLASASLFALAPKQGPPASLRAVHSHS